MNNKSNESTVTSFDLKLFDNLDEKCNIKNDETEIVRNCSYLLRIMTALKYKQLNGNELFVEFLIKSYYGQCLEDYIHFIRYHSNINFVDKMIVDLCLNYGFNECLNLIECTESNQHLRNRNDGDIDDDDKYNFYIDIFDGVHFYLFHLKESGFRICVDDKNDDDNKDDDGEYFNCFDVSIDFITKEVYEKKRKYDSHFDRLKSGGNSKFIIKQIDVGNENKINKRETFIDTMFEYIDGDDVKNGNVLNNLSQYIKLQEFDTDCIFLDISIFNNCNNCNLFCYLNNNIKCIQSIKTFIKKYEKHKNILANSFHTGYQFMYHPFYKQNDADKIIKNEQIYDTENDFDGVSVCDLYVCARYSSIKEEAINSQYITLKAFNEKVVVKGDAFIKTKKCRKIKNVYSDDPLHFGIAGGASLCKSHLYALICYCDFTDFCTAFSSTFRRIKWYEAIISVRKRNTAYANISKYLKQLIQYFGINGYDEKGPFFTGLSFCMNIGSFSIRLNGPTSTSKVRTIGVRFATSDGIVLQLNNNKWPGIEEHFFDSSWISVYPEEDERIYFCSRYKIQLESIIIVKTRYNYQAIMPSMYKFDSMLSGQMIYSDDAVTDVDVDIIGSSIKYILGDTSNKRDYELDPYILENFYLFTKKKTHIVLYLTDMNEDKIKNRPFVELIMHSIQSQGHKEIGNNNINLFKPIIFKLFTNLEQITIYTSANRKGEVNAFNMMSLLCILSDISLPKSFKRIVIKDTWINFSDSWLNKVFCDGVKKAFASKQLNIELKRNEYEEDWIIISV